MPVHHLDLDDPLGQGDRRLDRVGQPDGSWQDQVFSEKFACPIHPEVNLPELEPRIFSFNSPHGACPDCHGLGTTSEFDPEMIVNDESLSLETGAIEAWRKNGKRMNIYYSRILRTFARDFGVSYTGPYKDIPKKVRDILMYGTEKKGDNGTGTYFEGVIPNLQRRFENTESDWVQQKLHTYMSQQPCATCKGTRLKNEALAVRLHTVSSIGVEAPHELHTMRVGLGEPASGSDEHSRVAGGDVVINHGIDSDPTPP